MSYNAEIDKLAGQLCETTNEYYESHSYAAGYLLGMLAQNFDKLPEQDQLLLKTSIKSTIQQYEEKIKNRG